ncbi:hypothetical protein E2493_13075 [Sphingomonas parva]|uniref:Uncharacterized protein n=1 Tax=Sphingomonas parva TaxID=2555898 RepID=A0A4Y8ZP85_9SPHN|nr:DUF6445 family protein [Sphingomonas parva]TFI57828.1 hypothetical protein E2493_13075 [Sphingomonas parva]
MTPRRIHVGTSNTPVVIIDGFGGSLAQTRALADALKPYPPASNYYPGLRRVIAEEDAPAHDYVVRTLEAAAPFVGGGFDMDGFDLIEASFSIVTAPPSSLNPLQRAPHFDTTDPKQLAVLHYLSDTPGTGTAFFRQRSTGIERVSETNVAEFVAAARRESVGLSGYIQGSNAPFEQIGLVEALPDRLIIYPSCLLHSGIIPPDMPLSDDPRRGRLTANIFIRGH